MIGNYRDIFSNTTQEVILFCTIVRVDFSAYSLYLTKDPLYFFAGSDFRMIVTYNQANYSHYNASYAEGDNGTSICDLRYQTVSQKNHYHCSSTNGYSCTSSHYPEKR